MLSDVIARKLMTVFSIGSEQTSSELSMPLVNWSVKESLHKWHILSLFYDAKSGLCGSVSIMSNLTPGYFWWVNVASSAIQKCSSGCLINGIVDYSPTHLMSYFINYIRGNND